MIVRKLAFDKHNCMANNDVGTGNLSPMLQLLHMCGHAYMQLQLSLGMD